MLTKFFEWYRVVNSNPKDETIAKRTAAAKDLISRLDDSSDFQLITACVAGVVNGFETSFDQNSDIVKACVECIRKHQPAFPEGLSENALELRVLCAVAIGEILFQSLQSDSEVDDGSLLAASLMFAALPAHALIKTKHLQTILNELNVLADKVLHQCSLNRRKRTTLSFNELDEADASTLPAAVKNCLSQIQSQSVADREELDVLWWMYAGFSRIKEKALDKLSPAEMVFCCGGELANRVLIPPARSSRDMVRRAIRDNLKETKNSDMPLKAIASEWKTDVLPLLVVSDELVKQLVQNYPSLLPLSWLCNRLHENQGASGWGKEFSGKTGIADSRELSIEDWGIQVFNERIAQRVCLEVYRS